MVGSIRAAWFVVGLPLDKCIKYIQSTQPAVTAQLTQSVKLLLLILGQLVALAAD